MAIVKKILLVTILLITYVSSIEAQNGIAVSSNPGPDLHVALNWSPYPGAVKYNIFRKNTADANYPASPINATPTAIMSDCTTIKSILKPSIDSSVWNIIARALSGPGLFNPCNISTIPTGSEKYNRLVMLSKASMPIAIITGLGYQDNTVINGSTYQYKIVALNSSNTEIGIVASDMPVTAGSVVAQAPPSNVMAESGDDMVLIRWNNVPGAAGYVIERGLSLSGPFTRINESVFSAEVKNHLNGDTLIPSSAGFIDFKRRTALFGKDSTHLVNGVAIGGPKNSVAYYYRIKTLDLFQRPGTASAVYGPVIPGDKTEPSTPIDITANADDVTGKVTVRWTQVVRDKNGNWEYPDSTIKYRLYRFRSSGNPEIEPSVLIGQSNTIKGLKSREAIDADPGLRSTFGNKTWWYRLRAIDNANNISQWSSAVSVIVKDITKPDIVKGVDAKGNEKSISVKWKQNNEPDVASYMVYRSLCHLGSWVDCDNQKDTCGTWQTYDPTKTPDPKDKKDDRDNRSEKEERDPTGGTRNNPGSSTLPCPCSGPFVFLGEITNDSIKRAVSAGNFFFDDKTIPAGSPLCYAYWIKAKDSSGNLSGSFPIPSPAEKLQIKCERLRDKTPPENAIISGLFAQAEQIKVEWIGPPTQDTRAYHVYRADGRDPSKEPDAADYKWVGGMTVELPPMLPVVLTEPYKSPGIPNCDRISVQATPWMSQGFFEDKKIEPKLTYWYKVVGIDYDGNETPLDRAAAISTFSFTRKVPDAPIISTLDVQGSPCSVVLKWSPAFDVSSQVGFIIYRSTRATGPFLPIVVSPVTDNSYIDLNVVKGTSYWYAIAILMKNGQMTSLSAAKNITP